MDRQPIPFSGNPLDRAGNRRRDPAWLAEALAAPASRFLPFWRLSVLARESEPALAWLDRRVLAHAADSDAPVFLGLADGVAHFAVDISSLEEPLAALGVDGARFAEVRGLAGRLAAGEAGIAAQGRALLYWHDRHRFCSACGAPTSLREGGYMRKCEACNAEHFPRTDPAVIMVAWHGDRCILGRQKTWAPGMYSALAGFVEPGETIEEAVRREVKEEVGLDADEVVYYASQPWPFPSSLMIGCFAHVPDAEVEVDPLELDTARWFSREEVRRAIFSPDPSLGFALPGPFAIAHHLIKAWVERRAGP